MWEWRQKGNSKNSAGYQSVVMVKRILVVDDESPIPKLLTHSSNSVTKLIDQKIRWIIGAKMKEILSTNEYN